MSII
ncbi:uncharacterized protein FPRN_15252 [Fusarium proliferatum]|jgi:hypothetical protein